MNGVLLKPSRFGGANHANDYDSRSRYRQIGLSGPWRRCWWPGGYPPSIEASLRPGVLPEANAMSGRYRSLRLVAPLVARAPGTWSHRAADAAGCMITANRRARATIAFFIPRR